MKPLLLALLLLFFQSSPKPKSNISPELTKLREEFIQATKDYKQSLQKLLSIYEGNVTRSEEKLELSKKLANENLISHYQVEENERQLAAERKKVEETKKQIANADQQIAGIFDEEKLAQEYRHAVQQRRKARRPPCANWTLTAYQRTTSTSVTFGYNLVCH